MKKHFTLLGISVIMFAASCSKKDNNNNTNATPATPTYYFKAKINGTMYDGGTFLAAKSPDTPVLLSASCFITFKGGSYGYSIGIDNYSGAGNYTGGRKKGVIAISHTNDIDGYQTLNDDSTFVIKIISDDNATIKGEFSGKLYDKLDPTKDSVTVTEGTFYVPLIK
ncbi:MAG: hypothetical protein ACTHKV_09510 [Flavipsychrobacter sp.]